MSLLRCWRYKSSLLHKRSGVPTRAWEGGELAARDFSALRCVDLHHPRDCSACVAAPSVHDAPALPLPFTQYELMRKLRASPEFASERDRKQGAPLTHIRAPVACAVLCIAVPSRLTHARARVSSVAAPDGPLVREGFKDLAKRLNDARLYGKRSKSLVKVESP